MKWTKEEEEYVIYAIKNKKTYSEIGLELTRTTKSIKEKSAKLGYKFQNFEKYDEERDCKECKKTFTTKRYSEKIFCNNSCSAKFNNVRKNKKTKACLNCEKEISNRKTYCNNKCQNEYNRKKIFKEIENGNTSFNFRWYKKYLIEKYGHKCMECDWAKINKYSNKIPVEMEHMDGNADNNDLKNLKLLCPSCHSLTPTYKALNIGNGRGKRKNASVVKLAKTRTA